MDNKCYPRSFCTPSAFFCLVNLIEHFGISDTGIDFNGGNRNEKRHDFVPVMLVIGILLFLVRATGMTSYIAISVVGILALVAYTAATKKAWKVPTLEIIMRAFYGISLITAS